MENDVEYPPVPGDVIRSAVLKAIAQLLTADPGRKDAQIQDALNALYGASALIDQAVSRPLFVVVNTSQQVWGELEDGAHPVMPGEEPHTMGHVGAAIETLAGLVQEHNHSAHSAPIYQLFPVSPEAVQAAVDAELAQWEKE